MKWAEGQIAELKELCFAEKSNSELAGHFDVPISEIYAKRSQLAITIDKVKAAKDKPENQKARILQEKKRLIQMLEPVIRFADNSVTGLELSEDGHTVLINYGQWGKKINVECDSHLAVIFDVAKKCLY